MKIFTNLFSLLFMLLIIVSEAMSQNVSVTTRFSNPQFDKKTNTYSLDVELNAQKPGQQLFGMNVRFFYDVANLSFKGFSDYLPGYDQLGEDPKIHTGNANSGPALFGLDGPVAYINGAVQLQAPHTDVFISDKEWTKYFTVNFDVVNLDEKTTEICPAVIWDKQTVGNESGGFFPGEGGVVITLVETLRSSNRQSKPSDEFALQNKSNGESRNGDLVLFPDHCVQVRPHTNPVIDIISVYENHSGDFALHQNAPNPFISETIISFELPKAAEILFSIYDVTGKEQYQLSGAYPAGLSKLKLHANQLANASGVLFYRLDVEGYGSLSKKMTIVR